MNSFEKFLIAHLIADFLLQNNWIALNKTKKFPPLIAHAFIYTICLVVAFPSLGPWAWILGLLHGIVDCLSLGDKWLRLIGGRTFKDIEYKDNVYVGFTCLVYTVVDFLIHFLTTYPIIVWFIGD